MRVDGLKVATLLTTWSYLYGNPMRATERVKASSCPAKQQERRMRAKSNTGHPGDWSPGIIPGLQSCITEWSRPKDEALFLVRALRSITRHTISGMCHFRYICSHSCIPLRRCILAVTRHMSNNDWAIAHHGLALPIFSTDSVLGKLSIASGGSLLCAHYASVLHGAKSELILAKLNIFPAGVIG